MRPVESESSTECHRTKYKPNTSLTRFKWEKSMKYNYFNDTPAHHKQNNQINILSISKQARRLVIHK